MRLSVFVGDGERKDFLLTEIGKTLHGGYPD
jgi:hypothetical protein